LQRREVGAEDSEPWWFADDNDAGCAQIPEDMTIMAGPIVWWDQARPLPEDGRVVETSPLLALTFASNSTHPLPT
jgi:hypothetical protein